MNRNIKKPVVVTNWFWGYVRTPGYSIRALDCIPPAQDSTEVKPVWLASVTARKKFGQLLATLFTLGIYNRCDVTWECASPAYKEGNIKLKPKPKPKP